MHSHWQKEQQLIRKKFQIPYNMTYTSQLCHQTSMTSSLKLTVDRNRRERKPNQMKKQCSTNDVHLPPIFCSTCHSNPIECSCENGLGQWWTRLHQRSSLSIVEKKSLSNSISARHMTFATSLIDLTSIEQSKSSKPKRQSHSPEYVLLNWNNRQSLLDYLQTIQHIRTISKLTLEQLQQQISTHSHIHLFDSIIDLLLTMTKDQHHISVCQIYIDPSHYSLDEITHPFSQSHCIADNTDLHSTLNSIQNLAIRLGLKIELDVNEFSFENRSTKQRKSILNQHSLYLASKMPSNIFQHSSVPTR